MIKIHFNNYFIVLIFIFLGVSILQTGSVCAMKEVGVEKEGCKEKEKKNERFYKGKPLHYNGRVLVAHPKKEFEPMFIREIALDLVCEDPQKGEFVFVKKEGPVFRDEETQFQDPIDKIEKGVHFSDPIEIVGKKEETEKKDNLALEGFGDDMAIVDQELVDRDMSQNLPEKVEKSETDLLAESLVKYLKNLNREKIGEKEKELVQEKDKIGEKNKEQEKEKEKLGEKNNEKEKNKAQDKKVQDKNKVKEDNKKKNKSKGKNKAKENGPDEDLLDMCKRAIQEDVMIRELAKKVVMDKKKTKRVTRSMIGGLGGLNGLGRLGGVVDGAVGGGLGGVVSGVVGDLARVVENLEDSSTGGSLEGDSSGHSALLSKFCDFALKDSQKNKENASKMEADKKKTEIKNRFLSLGTLIVGVTSLLTGGSSIVKMFGVDTLVKNWIIGGGGNSTNC